MYDSRNGHKRIDVWFTQCHTSIVCCCSVYCAYLICHRIKNLQKLNISKLKKQNSLLYVTVITVFSNLQPLGNCEAYDEHFNLLGKICIDFFLILEIYLECYVLNQTQQTCANFFSGSHVAATHYSLPPGRREHWALHSNCHSFTSNS